MRRNHAQEDAIEGFDTSELPPMGPQGIQGAEDRRLPLAPPRLCEVGPCVHYHCFKIQLDVESPRAAGIEPGGKMAGDGGGQPFHVSTNHYCYPDVGIETVLGSTPVMECNRWQPVPLRQAQLDAQHREAFFAEDPRGVAYRNELAAWTEASANAAELEHDEVATWATINLRDGDVVRMYNANGELHGELDADTARAFLTMDELRRAGHSGNVRITITHAPPTESNSDDPSALENTLTVEVK